jgi:ADP-ribosylglycohydrolase
VSHDPLNLRDVVRDELEERRTGGYDVAATEPEVERALEAGSNSALLRALWSVEQAKLAPGWPYREPSAWGEIHGQLPPAPDLAPLALDDWALVQRLRAAWQGRAAGRHLGRPARGWSHRQIPVDYTLLGLHVLETYGAELDTRQVAEQWLEHLPIRQVHTAERAAYRNLVLGLEPPATAAWRNPYREWNGAQIRADVWGYVRPGDPAGAAALAFRDASLSHTGNGIYGALWVAGLLAASFVSADAATAIQAGLGQVPARSRLAETLREVLAMHADGAEWAAVLQRVREACGRYHWMHAICNSALVAAALLWGEGSFEHTIDLAVRSGWDTDCNGATVGSVLGAAHGMAILPPRLVDRLGDRIRGAILGTGGVPAANLAERTLAASGRSRRPK